jgi:hypothetical protein
MPSATFDTPEFAALDGFPGVPCRVVASAREGDDAYVVLDTGAPGRPYLYGICVAREHGGWVEGTSGNGPGWTLTDGERGLGTATAWGEAPEGAVRVRATFGGEVREVPVANGVYLVAWWRVPFREDGGPRVEAFRVGGRWVPA